jgi:hypothetical protein
MGKQLKERGDSKTDQIDSDEQQMVFTMVRATSSQSLGGVK